MHNNAAVSELMEFLQSQYSKLPLLANVFLLTMLYQGKVAEKMDRMLAEGTINYTGKDLFHTFLLS